ncbi:hypothetical protein GMA12_11605 [Kocuria sediminis]|uniref:Uncharacterized protein n=1 Tax=Kocuria sediminis TaxID=1038857 RepID=A0A6N8GNH1_9MICC|nr:hypothetical protein [Kocuria sediminis]MUN63777.1 hypothetical protein [Kocuria sediminis]
MGDRLYELMDARQAADALDAYLAERAPALRRLRKTLVDHGLDPEEMLDGSVYSVSPLWAWISARATECGVAQHPLTEDPTRHSWSSWARHGRLVDPHPTVGTLRLVDGFVSYLGQILCAAVPGAIWVVGEHRIAAHPLLNRPVLAAGHHQIFLPLFPLYGAYQCAYQRFPMSGTEMLAHTRRTIHALEGGGTEAADLEEPMVTVVAEVGCFDVGLREDVAAHPGLVEQLVAELADRDGILSVYRYGPAAIVVDFPDWDELQLDLWCTLWLQRHLPR